MKKITLTFEEKNTTDKQSLYEYLHKKIDLNENNLDEIYHYFANIKEDIVLMVINAELLKSKLGNYGGSLLKMLNKAAQKNKHLKIKIIYQAAQKKYEKQEMPENAKNKKEKLNTVCKYAKKCGGCNGQNKEYQDDLEKKQIIVRGLLGDLCKVEKIHAMEQPYHYRHKVHAVFAPGKKGEILAGVYEEGTHKIVSIDSCKIENQTAGKIIQTIKKLLPSFKITPYDEDKKTGILRHVVIRAGYYSGQMLVVFVTAKTEFPSKKNFVRELIKRHPEITSVVQNINDKKTSVVFGYKENVWYGSGYIEDFLCGMKFHISARSFYQVNPKQTEYLYETAISYAKLTGKEKIIDAYCGIGTIGLIASKYAKEVIGVELNREAIKDAKVNTQINKVKNATFYCEDAKDFMLRMAANGEDVDVVFMDPPREGSAEEFLQSVVTLAPKKVVYISCNPETLKRDLKYLLKHSYQIEKCQPVDLFPWTGHCEMIALLSLKTSQPKLEVTMEVDSDSNYTPEEHATYQKIKEYVKDKYGVNVHTSYIAQVKRMCGLDMGENYNKSKKENPEVKQCPQDKVEYIKDALRYFNVI